ncbi:MAG: LysM domain-containing protein [Actinomycetota bacterium]
MTTATMIRPADVRRPRAHRAGPVGASCTPPAVSGGGPTDRYVRVRRPRPVSSPNYGLRRLAALAVASVVAVGLFAAVGGVVASFGGAPASAAEASPAFSSNAAPAHHVAQPGDTLWSIADKHRGGVDHGRFVDALIRLNGGTTRIEVGQAVRLP